MNHMDARAKCRAGGSPFGPGFTWHFCSNRPRMEASVANAPAIGAKWKVRSSGERAGVVRPAPANVRGNAGQALGRQGQRKDDRHSLEPGRMPGRRTLR